MQADGKGPADWNPMTGAKAARVGAIPLVGFTAAHAYSHAPPAWPGGGPNEIAPGDAGATG